MINISAYKFITLDDLPILRESLREKCLALGLKGTILLSAEGINIMLSGEPAVISDFKATLQKDIRFADLTYKESQSDTQPYKRMFVKIKKEIIPLGIPGIEPSPAYTISPSQLKQWLDEGRDVTLLDVRNHYEVELGTFKNAVDLELKHFRFLPKAVHKLDPKLKEKPLITFCTGGIRCEKALPVLLSKGFKEVYQLAGGILNYFAETGGAHYEGECFVFDQRGAINAKMDPRLRGDDTTKRG